MLDEIDDKVKDEIDWKDQTGGCKERPDAKTIDRSDLF